MSGQSLEVSVDSVASAVAAVQGGADRLELCSALSEGGLTPTLGLLRAVKKHIPKPTDVFCIVRPRGGPMVYSKHEAELILDDAASLKAAGTDGFVFGALTLEGTVDQTLSKQFIEAASGLPCTFHRAFDLLQDPVTELETVIQLGYQRVLTSGKKVTAVEGCDTLAQLVSAAGGRISIMAGAGVKSSNVAELVRRSGVKECHASARVCREFACKTEGAKMGVGDDNILWVTSEEEVRAIKEAMATAR